MRQYYGCRDIVIIYAFSIAVKVFLFKDIRFQNSEHNQSKFVKIKKFASQHDFFIFHVRGSSFKCAKIRYVFVHIKVYNCKRFVKGVVIDVVINMRCRLRKLRLSWKLLLLNEWQTILFKRLLVWSLPHVWVPHR